MKTFKDVYITLNEGDVDSFIEHLTERLKQPWRRAYDTEERSQKLRDKAFCFERLSTDELPSAGLSIFQKDSNTWYIPNVVPLNYGQLNFDEYNAVITDFYENFIKVTADALAIHSDITSGLITEADILGVEGAKKLEQFTSMANMSSGSSHPSDKRRWLDFIITTYHHGKRVDTHDLERLLLTKGWSELHAQELAIQFEFGIELLEQRDHR
ncbi:hypothetical protein [Pseudidiomarina mangrovi]|uniref:hypothetical protein n=1 Tax=Pseudidiomarina mangrovi TaxID=2487133 RepID=UPI000FCC54DF|nr:hypothetical protein [Pseudidiomarina mangrovi]